MVLTTFNQELYEKNLKQDAFEDGKAEGVKEGITLGEYNKLKEQVCINF